MTEPTEALAALILLRDDVVAFRRLLWLHHGHSGAALYGDDGELQCHACPSDFKRDPASNIEARLLWSARDKHVQPVQQP